MNIIVTGASRGIGFETVKIFAQDPQNNVFAIARGKGGLEKLKQTCRNISGIDHVHIFPFDLLQGNYRAILVPEILSKMNKVDILLNNAGLLLHKPFEMMEESDFDLMFHANVKSVFNLTRHLLPYFSKNAHIVNIGSMGGFQGSLKFAGLSYYSAAKGALAILTECLAAEYADRGISFNCLCPGAVQTEMFSRAFPGAAAPVSPAEMAAFIADFAINGNKFFNGKILPVALSVP